MLARGGGAVANRCIKRRRGAAIRAAAISNHICVALEHTSVARLAGGCAARRRSIDRGTAFPRKRRRRVLILALEYLDDKIQRARVSFFNKRRDRRSHTSGYCL